MTSPGYAALLVLHILAAVVGFGALGATASFASAVRKSTDPFGSERLARYFRPGHNVAARVVYLVPVLGAALLIAGHGSDDGAAFPWIGLGLWVLAVGAASGALWPAERTIQAIVASRDTARLPDLSAACRRCARAGAVTSVCFVAAFIVMVVQPR